MKNRNTASGNRIPRAKKFLFFSVLIGAGLLLGAMFAEVMVRLMGWSFPLATYVYDGQVSLRRPYAWIRNTVEVDRVLRLNNFGFHDEDWQVTGAGRRVLLLGDSMLEGVHVPHSEGFCERWEQALTALGQSVECLNAGVTGTGTADQFHLWNVYLREAVEADAIVLFVFLGNDFENNHPEIGSPPVNLGSTVDEAGKVSLHRRSYSGVQRTVRAVCRKSAALSLLYRKLYRWRRTRLQQRAAAAPVAHRDAAGETEAPVVQDPGGDRMDASIAGTTQLILNWDEQLADEGKDFSVVVLGQTSGDLKMRRFVAELFTALRARGRACLHLETPTEDLVRYQSFDGQTIGHYNSAGHGWVAERLTQWYGAYLSEGDLGGEGTVTR